MTIEDQHPEGTQPDDEHAEPEVVAAFATAGEAEVAAAKLRGSGIEAVLDDQVEGGSVPVEGEDVFVQVRAEDAPDARAVLDDAGSPVTSPEV